MSENLTISVSGGPNGSAIERQISLLQLMRSNDPKSALFQEFVELVRQIYPAMYERDVFRDAPYFSDTPGKIARDYQEKHGWNR